MRLQQSDGRFNVVSISRKLAEGRALAVGDINADSYLDVYALQGASGPSGTEPARHHVPQRGRHEPGAGADPRDLRRQRASVSEIDYNHDGIADFIVTNGARKLKGPVQLITFPPPVTPPPAG